MSPNTYDINGDQYLPPIDGPKLRPFTHRREPIEFLKLLSISSDAEGDSSTGGHAHVFKVRIKGLEYALKVFKFFDIDQAREYEFPFHNRSVDTVTMTYQSDPFFAECRAYGRIEEIQARRQARSKGKRVPELAVPSYGFLGLPAVPFEDKFRQEFNIVHWNRRRHDRDQPPKKRRPFRAIVKRLVDHSVAILNPRKMARDLKKLQIEGVIQQDIYERNYMNGLLVDFSAAWTRPHWVMNVLSSEALALHIEQDSRDFDHMLEESNLKTKVRLSKFKPRYATLRRLPSRWVWQRSLPGIQASPSPSLDTTIESNTSPIETRTTAAHANSVRETSRRSGRTTTRSQRATRRR